MTSVIFAGTSGEVNAVGTRSVTLTVAPLSSDVLVLVYSGGGGSSGGGGGY